MDGESKREDAARQLDQRLLTVAFRRFVSSNYVTTLALDYGACLLSIVVLGVIVENTVENGLSPFTNGKHGFSVFGYTHPLIQITALSIISFLSFRA